MLLVCYDIESNSLRAKVAQRLLQAGLERINRSVFLGAPNATQTKHLEKWLENALQKAGPNDSLIALPVTQNQVWAMTVLGQNNLDIPTITGDRDTLIL